MFVVALLCGLALADEPSESTPVVFGGEGSADVARETASRRARRPADEFYTISLADLMLGRDPVAVSDHGEVQACGDAPRSQEHLLKVVEQAESHVDNQREGAALSTLDVAVETLVCLQDHVDPQLAARVHFLRGVVAHRDGDVATSLSEFRQALIFDLSLQWDDGFNPQIKQSFEAAVESMRDVEVAHLVFVPHPGDGALWVDGEAKPAGDGEVVVAAGRHLIQIYKPLAGSVVSGMVEVLPGQVVEIVVPHAVPTDALGWASDRRRWHDLSNLFLAVPSLREAPDVYVVHKGGVWRGSAGGAVWVQEGPSEGQTRATALTVTGVTLMAAGGGLAVYGGLRSASLVTQALDAQAAGDLDSYRTANTMVGGARAVGVVGGAVAAVGTTSLVLGLGPLGAKTRVGPMANAFGAQMTWTQ